MFEAKDSMKKHEWNAFRSNHKLEKFGKSHSSKASISFFVMNDQGEPALNEEEQKKLRMSTLQSIYYDQTGNDPIGKTAKELQKGIEDTLSKRYPDRPRVKLKIIIVRLNENTPTKTYLECLSMYNNFLDESKPKLIDKSIDHLGRLDPQKKGEIQALSEALEDAYKKGRLDDEHLAKLSDLREKYEHLREPLKGIETKPTKGEPYSLTVEKPAKPSKGEPENENKKQPSKEKEKPKSVPRSAQDAITAKQPDATEPKPGSQKTKDSIARKKLVQKRNLESKSAEAIGR